jgi:hypothetical protein
MGSFGLIWSQSVDDRQGALTARNHKRDLLQGLAFGADDYNYEAFCRSGT